MKKHPHPTVRSHHEVSHVLQQMIDTKRKVNLFIDSKKLKYPLLEFHDNCLFVSFPKIFQMKYRKIAATHIKVSFFVEGKIYYCHCKVLGFGTFAGEEAIRLRFPGFLTVDDEYDLGDVYVEQKIEVRFTSFDDGQQRKGAMVNMGNKGLDLTSGDSEPIHKQLNEGVEVEVHFALTDDWVVEGIGKVLYFHEDENIAGIEFTRMLKSQEEAQRLADWILEARRLKKSNAGHFVAPGSREAKRLMKQAAAKGEGQPDLEIPREDDNRPVLHQGAVKVLLVSENIELIYRMGDALKETYGVLKNRGDLNDVVNICKFLKPKLILIDERHKVGHGFDLCRRFTNSPRGDVPVLMMGSSKDREEKANRALRDGAAGFLVVDPFDAGKTLAKVNEAFEVFVPPEPVAKPSSASAKSHDFEPWLHEGPAPLLIAATDAGLIERMGLTLKLGHGVLRTRGTAKSIQKMAQKEKPHLVLMHETLKDGNGFDICQKLVAGPLKEIPVLMIGSDADLRTKQNEAVQAGAVDYLVVEPYDGLSLMEKATQTMELFAPPDDAPEAGSGANVSLLDDYSDSLWHEAEPFVLVAGEDRVLLDKIGDALKSKYGVLFSKGAVGNIELLAQMYDTHLIILSEKLGKTSGFDVARRLTSGPLEDIPVVIMGNQKDLSRMKNLAVKEGAVEYLLCDPFIKELFYSQIREVMNMFG
ncbi:Response regulatory domain-containing protein [Sulfidibacter corallicola]|uniref:Response regulatory domain-containing protein n=1 Tax=Sulfidibacter corallicola TaxID=2818388 RepID=A0A8A4TPS7_SULCO|nr:response regulator [Sulfidibacter corallicola]QTD51560.1 hypothetical protein J3U87_03745 [Sulfidibacter corallicola]